MRSRLFKAASRTVNYLESTKGGLTVSTVALTGLTASYLLSNDKQQANQAKYEYVKTGCFPFVTFHRFEVAPT